jgi:citronellol/citronellal dehydrogenase
MSEEFREHGIAVNALWPRTAIATDAIDLIGSAELRKQSRTVDIMSDAAYLILTKDSKVFTGNFVIGKLIKNILASCNSKSYWKHKKTNIY